MTDRVDSRVLPKWAELKTLHDSPYALLFVCESLSKSYKNVKNPFMKNKNQQLSSPLFVSKDHLCNPVKEKISDKSSHNN